MKMTLYIKFEIILTSLSKHTEFKIQFIDDLMRHGYISSFDAHELGYRSRDEINGHKLIEWILEAVLIENEKAKFIHKLALGYSLRAYGQRIVDRINGYE